MSKCNAQVEAPIGARNDAEYILRTEAGCLDYGNAEGALRGYFPAEGVGAYLLANSAAGGVAPSLYFNI